MKYLIIPLMIFSPPAMADTVELNVSIGIYSDAEMQPNVINCVPVGDYVECDDIPELEPEETETILVWINEDE